MEQEIIKLGRVKKSCATVQKVAKVMKVLMIVAAVLAFAAGVIAVVMRADLNDWLVTNNMAGRLNFNAGLSSLISTQFTPNDINSISIVLAIYAFEMTAVMIAFSVVMHKVETAFAAIGKADSPFTDDAIRKLTVAMVIVSIIVTLFAGVAFGILLGVITWAFYTILDYGRVLQIQSDETL